MKSEMKLPRERDQEAKFLENFREILENQKIKKFHNFGSNDLHLANFYFGIQQNAFGDGPWLRHVFL